MRNDVATRILPTTDNGQPQIAYDGIARKVTVGEALTVSTEAWANAFPVYGTAFSFIFLGCLMQPDGTRVIVLDLHQGGSSRPLYINSGRDLPADLRLKGITFKVLSLSDNGNCLEILVP